MSNDKKRKKEIFSDEDEEEDELNSSTAPEDEEEEEEEEDYEDSKDEDYEDSVSLNNSSIINNTNDDDDDDESEEIIITKKRKNSTNKKIPTPQKRKNKLNILDNEDDDLDGETTGVVSSKNSTINENDISKDSIMDDDDDDDDEEDQDEDEQPKRLKKQSQSDLLNMSGDDKIMKDVSKPTESTDNTTSSTANNTATTASTITPEDKSNGNLKKSLNKPKTNNLSSPTPTTTTTTKQTRSKSNNSPVLQQKEEEVNEGLYHCDYCQKDISGVVRIRCSVCPDFDLCLECFSVGVEITPHKNDHDYHVIDNLHFPMFTDEWGADEELLLLEAIELYGLGNWNEVSENVGSHSKSASECKSHYFTYYLNTSTSPLPNVSKCLTTKENLHFKRAKQTINVDKNKKYGTRQHNNDEGPSGPVTDSVGYMINRKHFEVEYDNEAELVVKDLVFENEDSQSDREIKLKVLESYDQRLEERIRRRKLIVDKGLLDYKKVERKRFKEDKEILNSLKCFLQCLTKEDHETLINGFISEKNIKNRIIQLQEYRENGIKTLTDGANYDEEKRKRESDKSLSSYSKQQRSKGESGFGFGLGSTTSSSSSFNNSQQYGNDKIKTQKQVIKEKEDHFLGVSNDKKSSKLKKNAKTEMEGLPNSDVLSLNEKQVCSTFRLLPQQYLLVKEALISESLKTDGNIKPSVAFKLIKFKQDKTLKLLEFFEKSGWLKIVNN